LIGVFREALHPLDDADGFRALDIDSPADEVAVISSTPSRRTCTSGARSSRSFCIPEKVRELLPTLTAEAPPPPVLRAWITVHLRRRTVIGTYGLRLDR
jgi:hypothetical protein